jgi:2-keto-4-pentenoate hydratase/2-oxohepta-3-ene-1,7-dioic acid hydratase in catechol pathway
VSPEQAYDHVFGYTIMNDVSARSLQTRHKQWYFGKSLDGFTPMGPWIVTTDELPGKPALDVRCRVNGELRQTSNTSLLIHDVAQVISTLSQGMVLRPGTIIAMGTPAGVGMGFHPPKWLKSGDVVTCEIEGIGTLTNTVSR